MCWGSFMDNKHSKAAFWITDFRRDLWEKENVKKI